MDAIVAARPSPACTKVALVPHSDAVNAALVAAERVSGLGDKVSIVRGLAPCIELDLDDFFITGAKDETSIQTIYDVLLAGVGLTNLFGPIYDAQRAAICADVGNPYAQIVCNNYLTPDPSANDPQLKETGLMAYRHLNLCSAKELFAEYDSDTLYDVTNLTIPFNILLGADDTRCYAT